MADPLFYVSYLLEKDYYPILIILTFLALAFSKHRRALLLAMIVVVLLTPALKTFYHEERPCKSVAGLVDCNDYGFPSGHGITSIILPAATLGTYLFFFFLPVAFTIAFSRMYLGVHTLNQIVGGIALGLFVYFVLQRLHPSKELIAMKKKLPAKAEEIRQFAHILMGFVIIGMVMWLDGGTVAPYSTELILLAVLISGLMIINMKMLKMNAGPFESVLKYLERKDPVFAGRGPLLYLVGMLLLLSYARDANFMLGAIAIFATGDGFSTLIGRRHGERKLSWNPRKSWEGTLAFFIFGGLAAYYFMGMDAFLYSAILALVESLDFHIDDNLLVPFFALVLNLFLG